MRQSVRNPYGRVFWTCLALGVLLFVVMIVLVANVPEPDLDARTMKVREALMGGAIFSGIIGLVLVVCGLPFWFLARQVQRYVDALPRNACLVHWSYLPEEWEMFQEVEAPLLQRDFRSLLVAPFLMSIPVAVVLLAVLFSLDHKLKALPFVLAATAVFFGLVMAVAYYIRVVRRRSWGRRHRLNPPDSYVALEFAHANGEFVFFCLFNQRLIDVQLLVGEPSMIEVTIRSYAPRGGEMLEKRRVLVPVGQDEAAGQVVAQLRAAWRLG